MQQILNVVLVADREGEPIPLAVLQLEREQMKPSAELSHKLQRVLGLTPELPVALRCGLDKPPDRRSHADQQHCNACDIQGPEWLREKAFQQRRFIFDLP